MFLEISQNLQKNTCARFSFLIKFIKKETLTQVTPVNFEKFLRTPFLTAEHFQWLLVKSFRVLKKYKNFFFKHIFSFLNKKNITFLPPNLSSWQFYQDIFSCSVFLRLIFLFVIISSSFFQFDFSVF